MLAAAMLAAVLLVPTRRAGPPPPGPSAISSQRHAAPAGAPLTLTLSDGSRVVLAPGSHLVEATTSGERRVMLEGRAYFDVVPDESRPFLVDAGGTRTRVLGTRFDVRAYPGSGATEVLVRSGRVSVSRSSEARPAVRPLGTGDRVRVTVDGGMELESGLDVEALLAWTGGNLVFRGTPLRDVVPELEGWFGVTIRISDPTLAGRRITATFVGEPEDVVLGAVAELVGARVERSGRQVVFVPFRRR